MSNPHKTSNSSHVRITRTCGWVKPPLAIQKVASILGLSHLKQGDDGQWQASDRHDNRYTMTSRLIQSVLGKSSEAITEREERTVVHRIIFWVQKVGYTAY